MAVYGANEIRTFLCTYLCEEVEMKLATCDLLVLFDLNSALKTLEFHVSV